MLWGLGKLPPSPISKGLQLGHLYAYPSQICNFQSVTLCPLSLNFVLKNDKTSGITVWEINFTQLTRSWVRLLLAKQFTVLTQQLSKGFELVILLSLLLVRWWPTSSRTLWTSTHSKSCPHLQDLYKNISFFLLWKTYLKVLTIRTSLILSK